MQCFESRKWIVDSLDENETLSPDTKAALDAHLKTCAVCPGERARIGTLVGILKTQPHYTVPVDLRDTPTGNLTLKRWRQSSPKKIWKSLPVGVRLLTEGVTIACVVMLGIQMGPRLRALYEERVDARLQKMIAAEDEGSDGVPLLSHPTGSVEGDDEAQYSEGDETEVLATNHPAAGASDVQVGKSEIWRFNIKTDSPALVRAQIIKTLREQNIADTTPGFGGLEAPGGIQFDLLVPVAAIPPLKSALESLAGPKVESLPFSETFTWYKNRSRKPIPPGTARIVIWLSQI